MTQHLENKCLPLEDILEILRSEVAGMPVSSTSVRYLRALESLRSSIFSLQASTPSEKKQQAPLAKTAQPILSEAPILPKADTASADTVSADTASVDTASADAAPADTASADTAPADTASADTASADTSPADTASADTASADTASADTSPADLAKDKSSLIINNLSLALTNWLVNQWLMSVPFTTASLQLDIISALYGSAVKAGRLPKTKVFSDVKTRLKALGPEGWKSGIDQEIFTHALRLTKNVSRLIADDAIAADLILLSLTHGLQPLEQLALIKKEDIDPAYSVAHGTAVCNRPEPSASDQVLSGVRAAGLSSGENTAPRANTASANTAPRADTDPKDPILRSRYSPRVISLILNNLFLGSARRKYLFQLDQSKRTPAQLKRHIAKICNALFKRARLPQATDPMQTVEALWAYAALRAGIPASALVSHLGHAPLGLPILKLSVGSYKSTESRQAVEAASNVGECGKQPPGASPRVCGNHDQSSDRAASEDLSLKSEDRAADTAPRAHTPTNDNSSLIINNLSLEEVGKIFLDNPPRWYAMSLRPGVRFTQVCRRIQLLSKTHTALSVETSYCCPTADTSSIQLFYPCEEIARAIGKKIVIKQRPFIHSVVFFKAKLTDIGPLFAKIGDLAWCYRQSARPGAPYADITETQFRQFQQTIARFTPDYEVAPSGELELKKNDRVQIVGGLFAGQTASFDSVAHGRAVCNNNTVRSANSPAKAADTAQSADTPSVVYRLNIIGENGIEWRINVDSRLAKQKNT